jgi:hypothetical protein
MALDPRYVLAPSLQMYFVDKDTGLPLSGGLVYFFEDDARTIPKPVYEISGSPTAYTYTVLPNPVILSSVGTFQDNTGSDILPYYFPFDVNGNIELYYIAVYDSSGVLQFTREGWPNTSAEDIISTSANLINFVPNGQFLLHDNVPASVANGFIPGKISQDTTVIAQGGWSFVRGPASSATDFVTFPQYVSYIGTPTGNPRYAVQIQTTVTGSDTRKDLVLTFRGVNTFASDTQLYNFYFEGEAENGSDINNVQIIVRKFFGTGGTPSAPTETIVGTISLLDGIIQEYNTTILFGDNASKTIGTNNDDTVHIIIRLPPTSAQTALMTDFALIAGNATLQGFPTQTEAQQIGPSTAGWFPVPNPNGFDLYCPAVLGTSGLLFDHSSIGEIISSMVPAASQVGNLLYCDGTQYRTADYSPLGIPYARLGAVLFNSTYNLPIFGTGVNFVNAYSVLGGTGTFMLSLNKLASVQANPADGTIPTGFTFNININNSGAAFLYLSRTNNVGVVTSTLITNGLPLGGASAGTSGMLVYDYTEPATFPSNPLESSVIKYSFIVVALAANTLAAGVGIPGKYFQFSNTGGSFRLWFKVNGEIAPAAGGLTLFQINLSPNMTLQDVGIIISNVIAGFQNNTISVLPAASIAGGAGSFFTLSANSIIYTFWYKIGGIGVAPAGSANPIQVTLIGNETAAQVATKTITAINTVFFAVPDLRGLFLRGTDPTGIWDSGTILRSGAIGNIAGTNVGTFELSQFVVHSHPGSTVALSATGFIAGPGANVEQIGGTTAVSVAAEGGSENRPVNVFVDYFIRY